MSIETVKSEMLKAKGYQTIKEKLETMKEELSRNNQTICGRVFLLNTLLSKKEEDYNLIINSKDIKAKGRKKLYSSLFYFLSTLATIALMSFGLPAGSGLLAICLGIITVFLAASGFSLLCQGIGGLKRLKNVKENNDSIPLLYEEIVKIKLQLKQYEEKETLNRHKINILDSALTVLIKYFESFDDALGEFLESEMQDILVTEFVDSEKLDIAVSSTSAQSVEEILEYKLKLGID